MARILDISDGYTSATEPTVGSVAASGLKTYADDAAFVTAKGSAAADGDTYYNTTSDLVRVYANSAWANLAMDASVVHVTGVESIAGDKTFSDDVIVTGDFTVNGTTTLINTTNLEVEDQNILVNNGGNDVSSEGAGITVERTGTNGSIIYAAAATSKFKCGALGTEKEVATLSDVQAFTNKDYDGGTASDTNRITLPKNTTTNLTGLTRKQATMFYDTTVNKIKYDDGSNLKNVGSGGGGINYLEDWKLLYTGYNDGASATPVDGTGGSLTDLTLTLDTTDPMDDVSDLKIAKAAADAQGEGVAFDLTVPSRAPGNMQTIKFRYRFSNADVPDDTFTVWLYKKDATAGWLQPTPYGLKVSTIVSEFRAQVQLDYSATTSTVDDWRLVIHCAGTDASAVDLYINDLEIGPTQYASGFAGWKQYALTVTGSNFTNTRSVGIPYKSIDGAWRLKFNVLGALSGSNSTITLAVSGVTFKNTAGVNNVVAGYLFAGAAGAVANAYASLNSGNIVITMGSSQPYAYAGASGDVELESMPTFAQDYSNVIMSDYAETRVVDFIAGLKQPSGSLSGETTVILPSFDKDTHGCYSTVTGLYTVKIPGDYDVDFFSRISGSATAASYYTTKIYVNAVEKHRQNEDTTGANRTYLTPRIKGMVACVAGDTIKVTVQTNLTSAVWDASLASLNIAMKQGPTAIASSEKEFATATRITSGQSITDNVNPTEVVFNSNFDYSHSGFDTATGRYTFKKAGVFLVSYGLQVTMGGTAPTSVKTEVYKNGLNTTKYGIVFNEVFTASKYYTIGTSFPIRVNSGDYISLWILPAAQDVTVAYDSAANMSSFMSISSQGGV